MAQTSSVSNPTSGSDPLLHVWNVTSGSRNWLPVVLISLIIVFGAWVRTANLGALEFNNDELYHYYAAQSLSEGRGPELPSGMEYRRGLDVTRMVAVSNRHFAPPEFATRVPSSFFGVVSLVLMAAVAWAIGGAWAAVWATLLLAIYPEAVTQSRQTRFYTYQLAIMLVALYAGWRLVQAAGRKSAPDNRELQVEWLWAAILGAALALAVRVQLTTLSVAVGIGLALAIVAIIDLHSWGRVAWRRSVPVALVTAVAVGALAIVVLRPEFVNSLIGVAHSVPVWAGGRPGNPLAYYYGLSDTFPLLLALAPLIFLSVAWRNAGLAAYLFLWFAVPLVLHSFLFAWKGERFVITAMPGLFIATAMAATACSGTLLRSLRAWLERARVSPRPARNGSALLLGLVAFFAIVTTPAFNLARKAPTGQLTVQRHDWTTLGRLIREYDGGQQVPVGSSEAISALFYWERVDFAVNRGALEFKMETRSMGAPDAYTGIPVFVTPESIRERFRDHPFVLIGIDRVRWEHNTLERSLLNALIEEGEELCQGRCRNMLLYRWPLQSTEETPPATAVRDRTWRESSRYQVEQ